MRRQRPPPFEPGLKRPGRGDMPIADAQPPRPLTELVSIALDSESTMQAQRFGRNGGGDLRIAIAIATNPGRQRESPGTRCQAWEAGRERLVELDANLWKDIPQIFVDEVQASPYPGGH